MMQNEKKSVLPLKELLILGILMIILLAMPVSPVLTANAEEESDSAIWQSEHNDRHYRVSTVFPRNETTPAIANEVAQKLNVHGLEQIGNGTKKMPP